MALLLLLMIVPPLCAASLIAYRIWPVPALYGAAAVVWLALVALALAGLAFVAILNIALQPRTGWESVGAGLLTIYSVPLLTSGALALFLKPPPRGDREKP